MPGAPRDSLSGLNGGPPAGRNVASLIIQHGPQERPAGVSTHPTRAGGRVQRGADPFPEGERGLDAIRHDRNGSELASGDEKVRKETGIPGI